MGHKSLSKRHMLWIRRDGRAWESSKRNGTDTSSWLKTNSRNCEEQKKAGRKAGMWSRKTISVSAWEILIHLLLSKATNFRIWRESPWQRQSGGSYHFYSAFHSWDFYRRRVNMKHVTGQEITRENGCSFNWDQDRVLASLFKLIDQVIEVKQIRSGRWGWGKWKFRGMPLGGDAWQKEKRNG